jgi:hypothetical protein
MIRLSNCCECAADADRVTSYCMGARLDSLDSVNIERPQGRRSNYAVQFLKVC